MRTLLIVDDVKINRDILKNMLGSDYKITEASNGREALDIMQRDFKLISAVLLDLCMPVMDGFEVLAHMKESDTLSLIPVIVATGRTDSDAEEKALQLGAKDYISKPYNAAIIKQRIINTIRLRETAAEINALQRDRLTGLYSRESFLEKAEEMIAAHEPGYYTMSCFNIDNFKVINDQHGTAAGDEVLRHVAKCIKRYLAPIDGICCRVMADNFAMLYPCKYMDSESIAKNHEETMYPPCIARSISIRIGRYIVNDLSLTASAMYDRAALAEASIKGRYDQYVALYSESMRKRLLDEQSLVTEMREALAQRRFEIWYQPQYNHATKALIGAEALVRWRHAERGLILPGAFIPVFEKNGFIYELDKYVWEEVCRNLRRWIDEGRYPLPVSVNISRYDVFRADMVGVITGLVEKYAIPAQLLRLEITESAFAVSTKRVVSTVKELVAYGFTLEIDDFGSGYSSLNTLKSVPAQMLKLDMRFLESDDDSQRGGNIIESVVRMTKWLGMSVIAEGVERIEQADYLSSIGCSYVQGYLYAKPMPADEYEKLCCAAEKEEKLLTMETVENLDNNAFWDPNSMDTLIFNSYVGGACIYEYNGGSETLELLRASKKFTQIIGGAGMTVDDALRLNWMEHVERESGKRLIGDINLSIADNREITGEYVFLDLPGCPRETYLRSTMRVIASAGRRYLVYCINENITAQREAEQREHEIAEQLQSIMNNVNCGITAVAIDGEKTSYLLTNGRFYELLGYTERQYHEEIGNDAFKMICLDDRKRVRNICSEVYATGAPQTVEYRSVRRDGAVVWLRSSISLASFKGVSDKVQLSTYTDITAEKQAENELRETDDQLHFLNETAHELLAQPDSDKGINDALQKLLDYFSGNRAYVFEFLHDKGIANNTYEVCAAGVSSEIENLQNVPIEIMDFWVCAFKNSKYVDIDDVDALDESRADEKATLIAQGIRSLVAVPLRRDGELLGFIGIDDPRQHSRVDRLAALGDYIAVMLTRRDLNARISSDNRVLTSLMNDTPGGFVRMRVYPDESIRPVYFNEGFFKLTGMNYDELMSIYANDAFAGVHPDDIGIVKDAVADMFEKGEARSRRYRLRHGSGGYIWLMFFGRVIKEKQGDIFLNIYYTDVAEQVRADEQQRELLDNLPYGAALYEFDGKELSIVHLNKRFWELVERTPASCDTLSVMNEVCPEDQSVIMREVIPAISHKRDIACDLRILDGSGAYRPFHVVGRIVSKADGRYSIYAAYTPISDEVMSVQSMLPIVLQTMMETQTGFSAIKDKSLRYVCCSREVYEGAGLSSEEELIGKTDADVLPPTIASKISARDMQVLETGESILDIVERVPSTDGMEHYSATSKFPLKDASGNIIGIYSVGRDITDARARRAQLELLTNNIPGGIATYEYLDGKLKITYFNDGFCRLFNVSREEYALISSRDAFTGVDKDDMPALSAHLDELVKNGTPVDFVYKVHLSDKSVVWVNLKAVRSSEYEDRTVINAAIFDVTLRQKALEQLRISEEENRLALRHSRNVVCRYDVATRTLRLSPGVGEKYGVEETLSGVPYLQVELGSISPDTAGAYIQFYESIMKGEKDGEALFQRKSREGWRWLEAHFSTIFSSSGEPVSAVMSFSDATDKLEKDAVYRKWQQSIQNKELESYSLFRCNVSKKTVVDTAEGALLYVRFDSGPFNFDEHTEEYVRQCVLEEDADRFLTFLSVDSLLSGYYQGKRIVTLEYRERLQHEEGFRWLRLTVDLVEHSHSNDVEAYLLFENIDKMKRLQLATIEMAETDPLTGVMNRVTFAAQVEEILRSSEPGAQHALMMLDIDGFKQVNDVFGHGEGDQTLIDVSNAVRSVLRRGDLVGRLGGDEFLIFLADIPGDYVAANKAKQICALTRKAFSIEVEISGSIGMAVAPRDGTDFETLYKKVDSAMYHVKGSGKDSYAFYHEEMDDENLNAKAGSGTSGLPASKKRRMLIVDDSRIDHALLTNIFLNDFIVEKAKDGNTALIRLRHYGSSISVVLLDLMMPGMDGFAVLKKMQESVELKSIPVIVVSGDGNRETSLRAIREGAADFITKPVDPEILRIRVDSAISKAENERLRAKNSFLEFQNSEVSRYRTVLERSGVVVIENDWVSGGYIYDRAISEHIAGNYDNRKLWHIMLSDMVADTATVKRMQELAQAIASERKRTDESIVVSLKTPSKARHLFKMCVYKVINEFGLTGKLYITFEDIDTPPQR